MEPLQTWWTTELYPTSDEDNFGVVGNFEVVKAADAQATIAALQARVRELEARQHFGTCAKCLTNAWRICKEGTPDAVEMKCSNGSTWWLCDYCLSKEQLTQRTAEFQRHDGELQQICGQALGYPWFKDDQKSFPGATEKDGVCVGEHVGITIAQELANAYRKRTAELERVRADNKALDKWRADVTVSLQRPEGAFFVDVPQHIKDLMKERDELRTLIAALPKVEGQFEVGSGACYYVRALDGKSNPIVCGLMTEQAVAYAILALLKHRQGMEGYP